MEHDARLIAQLISLKQKLDANQIEIVKGDALAVASSLAPASFDVVFLDPPFDRGLLAPALDGVRTLLAPRGLVYAESPAQIAPA